MDVVFYLSAAIAVSCTAAALTRMNAVHALLYLIVALLALAVIFYTLGAPLAAAFEVMVNAGAIMVLFVFAALILNQGPQSVAQERSWVTPVVWLGPVVLVIVLLGELAYVLTKHGTAAGVATVAPEQVGILLLGPYLLAAEMASVLLLAGLVGAYHAGRRLRAPPEARA